MFSPKLPKFSIEITKDEGVQISLSPGRLPQTPAERFAYIDQIAASVTAVQMGHLHEQFINAIREACKRGGDHGLGLAIVHRMQEFAQNAQGRREAPAIPPTKFTLNGGNDE